MAWRFDPSEIFLGGLKKTFPTQSIIQHTPLVFKIPFAWSWFVYFMFDWLCCGLKRLKDFEMLYEAEWFLWEVRGWKVRTWVDKSEVTVKADLKGSINLYWPSWWTVTIFKNITTLDFQLWCCFESVNVHQSLSLNVCTLSCQSSL